MIQWSHNEIECGKEGSNVKFIKGFTSLHAVMVAGASTEFPCAKETFTAIHRLSRHQPPFHQRCSLCVRLTDKQAASIFLRTLHRPLIVVRSLSTTLPPERSALTVSPDIRSAVKHVELGYPTKVGAANPGRCGYIIVDTLLPLTGPSLRLNAKVGGATLITYTRYWRWRV